MPSDGRPCGAVLASSVGRIAISAPAQRPVEVERGTYQGQMRERLREVAQRLAAGAGLLGVEAEVVGVTEHLLEEQPSVFQSRRVRPAGTGERLDQPEGAHVEGSLAARQPVRGNGGIVPVDQAV